ncbi:hypothetical protein SEMRO_1_G000930.1 [Seminavis robusta]|uniref:Uncharacterized protein n=1 Tax=Seminavis robusta TaxID=568900 RepID=A0A9N8D6P8_9STRA|nr:hypothetical protein SEMRO_1_G000930.1 [Seminavis robusta]|eukprot:Sro1_g000930.1 n/a (694) ;mRNA; f:279583-281759
MSDDCLAPPPANGFEYDRRECLQVLIDVQQSGKKGKVIKEMLEKKYVPLKQSSIYELFRKFQQHREDGGSLDTFPNDRWHIPKGREPFLLDNEVKEIAEWLKQQPGRTIDHDELKAMMMQKRKDRLAADDKIILCDSMTTPCKDTIDNYSLTITDLACGSVIKKAIPKTPTRFTAERSVRSAAAFMATVVATHYRVVSEPVDKVEQYLSEITNEQHSLWNQRFVYEIASRLNENRYLCPVKTRYLASIDDTTEWAVPGKNREVGNKPVFTALTSFNLKLSVRSLFKKSKASAVATGMRLKVTHIMTAAGTNGPVWISATGLTERELPRSKCPSGVLVLEIEGLHIGGGGVTAFGEQNGFVMFVRNDDDKLTEKVKVEAFLDRCLFPFVSRLRQKRGWQPGTPVPDSMTFVTWLDGEMAQLATTVDPGMIGKLNHSKIIVNKQSAARSAVEQPCDASPIFKHMHLLSKECTMIDVEKGACDYKDSVVGIFGVAKETAGLNLASHRLAACVDFIACYPKNATKAVNTESVSAGFADVGMLGKSRRTEYAFPSLHGMIHTLGMNHYPQDLIDLFKNSLPRLVQEVYDKGHVEEAVFDELEFQVDKNYEDEDVLKQQSISQEQMQRAKCLTHEHQVELRAARLVEARAKQKEKFDKTVNDYTTLLKSSQLCTEKLLKESDIAGDTKTLEVASQRRYL